MEAEKKLYSQEEIKKIAPGYRGKAENFNPSRMGKKSSKPPPPRQNKAGPSTSDVPQPKLLDSNKVPTPQRNESMISDAIFGVDVKVQAIDPRQNFSTSFARLPSISDEIFQQYRADNNLLDRHIVKEEFVYYATALLWFKLIDVRAKQGRIALTSAEKDIRKAIQDKSFNVPQPLYIYLSQIGNVTDKMGKETEIEIPNLPTTINQNFGGYHALAVTEQHSLFEEVPSLGIAADAVMAVASADENPVQTNRVTLPVGSVQNGNLLCFSNNIGPRRVEIRQRLNGQGITPTAFPEMIASTRLNMRYILSLSDIVGAQSTFRVEKVVFPNLTLSGGETQIIMTRPVEDENPGMSWTQTNVQATSAGCESTAQMGAAAMFGFQAYKEQGPGANDTERCVTWSCIQASAVAEAPWAIPPAWVATRNERRNMPPGIGTERFRALSQNQSTITYDVIRRMIKTNR